jgi:hypothetical protein
MNQRETALSKAKCGQVLEFPRRRFFAIRVIDDGDAGWMVLAGPHGWRHGDAASAFFDAHWLARNFGLPIRWRPT